MGSKEIETTILSSISKFVRTQGFHRVSQAFASFPLPSGSSLLHVGEENTEEVTKENSKLESLDSDFRYSKTGFYDEVVYSRTQQYSPEVFTLKVIRLNKFHLLCSFQKVSSDILKGEVDYAENENEVVNTKFDMKRLFTITKEGSRKNAHRYEWVLNRYVGKEVHSVLSQLFQSGIGYSDLSKDVMLNIMYFLPIASMVNLFQVDRFSNSVSKQNHFWKSLIVRDYSDYVNYSQVKDSMKMSLFVKTKLKVISEFNARRLYIESYKAGREELEIERVTNTLTVSFEPFSLLRYSRRRLSLSSFHTNLSLLNNMSTSRHGRGGRASLRQSTGRARPGRGNRLVGARTLPRLLGGNRRTGSPGNLSVSSTSGEPVPPSNVSLPSEMDVLDVLEVETSTTWSSSEAESRRQRRSRREREREREDTNSF